MREIMDTKKEKHFTRLVSHSYYENEVESFGSFVHLWYNRAKTTRPMKFCTKIHESDISIYLCNSRCPYSDVTTRLN